MPNYQWFASLYKPFFAIQSSGDLISLFAQVAAHFTDLVAIEVDGNYSFHIATVRHSLAFVIELLV